MPTSFSLCSSLVPASWFHFLCKTVTAHTSLNQTSTTADPWNTELSHGDWTWIRTSVFMRWSNCHDRNKASVVLIVFSASPELRDRCQRLWNTELSGLIMDPFGLFVICLDELWLQAMGIVKIVGDEFSKMERVSHCKGQCTPSRVNHNIEI